MCNVCKDIQEIGGGGSGEEKLGLRGFFPLCTFVLVRSFKTYGYGKFQNKNKQNLCLKTFLAVVLQFFLLGKYKTALFSLELMPLLM